MTLSLGPAHSHEWPTAGRLLFAQAADPGQATARFLELIGSGDIDPTGILLAREEGSIRAAMLAQSFGGGQASVWPPMARGPGAEAIALKLGQYALDRLVAGGSHIVQALLDPEDPGATDLLRLRFQFLTTLLLMNRDIQPQDAALTLADAPVEMTPYHPADEEAFGQLLLASYEATLDCPELNGTRPPGAILQGYAEASPEGGSEWYCAHWEGTPVAILLLSSPGPGKSPWHLTYLGIIPEFRRRGLGRWLTRWALRRAAEAGTRGITLNVDCRNLPSLVLYEREGFHVYGRRAAYLWLAGDQLA